MGLLDKVLACVDILTGDPADENYQKGVDFEKYVISLFDTKYFSLHDWTRDISGKLDGVVVESDANPDLVMRYKLQDALIAVECKYRSSLYQGSIDWCSQKKLHGYQAYHKKTGIPVFIVIGVGGIPNKPDKMYCIPLADAKYPKLYPSVFEGFERPVYRRFFWRSQQLR